MSVFFAVWSRHVRRFESGIEIISKSSGYFFVVVLIGLKPKKTNIYTSTSINI